MASAGDEGRAKPRKCHARRKGSLTVAVPNGETHAFCVSPGRIHRPVEANPGN